MFPATDRDKGLMSMAWRAQSRTRLAAVFSEVDAWAAAHDGLKAYSKDIDLDGEPEYILRNDAVMAVFEAEGGLMTGAWLKEGTNVWQMVGNFAAQPETGYETHETGDTTSIRGAAMKDKSIGGEPMTATKHTVTTGTGQLTFKSGSLTKTVTLADAATGTFAISYSASGKQMYVRNGLSPDLATLLVRGQSTMNEEESNTSVSVTTDNGTRILTAAIDVTTGSVNRGANDKADGWNTVRMRNAAHVRDVEVTSTSSLAYTLTFTAGESASVLPVWSELPAPALVLGDTWSFEPATRILEGDPEPEITLATTATGYTFENGRFTFTPLAPGAYTFVFTAANTAGSVDATLTVSVTSVTPYETWMEERGYPGTTPATNTSAATGQTYGWHYAADIHPTNDTPLEIVITNPATSPYPLPPAPPHRPYNPPRPPDLTQSFTTNALGRGAPTALLPFPTNTTWFGGLEVTVPTP
jgi:hypothetical protein